MNVPTQLMKSLGNLMETHLTVKDLFYYYYVKVECSSCQIVFGSTFSLYGSPPPLGQQRQLLQSYSQSLWRVFPLQWLSDSSLTIIAFLFFSVCYAREVESVSVNTWKLLWRGSNTRNSFYWWGYWSRLVNTWCLNISIF